MSIQSSQSSNMPANRSSDVSLLCSVVAVCCSFSSSSLNCSINCCDTSLSGFSLYTPRTPVRSICDDADFERYVRNCVTSRFMSSSGTVSKRVLCALYTCLTIFLIDSPSGARSRMSIMSFE